VGEMHPGSNLAIAYYPQNATDLLDGDQTLLATMEEASPENMRTKLRGILGAFLFSGEDVEKKVKVLSGGEKARLALARLLLFPCNILILDEPTHHLDIPSKEILKKALNQFPGSIIVVSHDRDFLNDLTEHTLEFRDGRVKKHLFGINEYLNRRKLNSMRSVEKAESERVSAQRKINKKKITHKKRKELHRKISYAERKIEELEAGLKDLENEMVGDSKFYLRSDSEEVLASYYAMKKNLEDQMNLWEALQNELEE
jgi:ATP-binding cassette subfamily F protein 3